MHPTRPGGPLSRTSSSGSTSSSSSDPGASAGAVSPAGSPARHAERARRTAELPERTRSAGPGTPQTMQNTPRALQGEADLPETLSRLRLEAHTIRIDAVGTGFVMHGTITFDAELVIASLVPADNTRNPPPEQRRLPLVRALRFGDAPVLEVTQEQAEPAAPPSSACVAALSSQLEAWVAAAGSADDQGHRRIALETIELTHGLGFTALDLGVTGLDCLPDCLGLLTSVRWLELDDNRLSELPAVLPPNLERLSVCNNRLRHFPANLPGTVTDINVSGNFLTSIPATLHEGLIALNVSHNALETLPEALPMSLRRVCFNHNPIAEIPEWVYLMHPDTRLQFSRQSLSAASMQAAGTQAALRADGVRRGPTMVFSDVNSLPDADVHAPVPSSLTRPAAVWQWELNDQGELVSRPPGGAQPDWRSRLGAEPNDNRPDFIHLIDELQRTAEFSHPDLHVPFCRRVAALLHQLETDQAGRELCFAIAAEWSGTCEDGVALAFDNMEMALYCAELERGNLSTAELATLGGQMMRYEALEQFTLALPGARHMDLTEAALRLRTALIHDLDLPTSCRSMIYGEFAERSCLVNQDTIDAARTHVQNVTGGEALIDYLVDWRPWITRLTLDNPQRAAEVAQSNQRQRSHLTQQMEALFENKEQMNSGEYHSAVKTLAEQYNAIDGFDTATRRELTIAAIESIVARLSGPMPAAEQHQPA